MVIRMVRTKVLAILLGPAGIGLEAIYDSVVTLLRTAFDAGLGSSGVRQIAVATASDDPRKIATTTRALRRSCIALGAVGAVALFFGRDSASRAAFGDTTHATAFGWLAIAIFFGVIAGGQGALLQGMRRIGDLAKMNILGTALGALVSIPVVLVWGMAGIPAYMIIGAAVSMLMAWYYARKVSVQSIQLPISALAEEARGLFALGLAFMLTALISTGATFLLRAIVTREYGLEGAGQFQAASALSLIYVGFILQAMSTDFYPRLTAVAADDGKCNRIVNEQAEISLLLALPGVLGTVAFAPWVIRIFYTGSFDTAAEILVWQMGGVLLRVISWPLGFMTLAKGRSAVFFWTDAAAYAVYVALAWVGLKNFGLVGAGMAFLGLYVFYVAMMYGVARRLSGFRWDSPYLRYVLISFVAAIAVLWVRLSWPEPWATLLPCLIAAGAGIHSVKQLTGVVGVERVQRVLNRFRLAWIMRILSRRPL